MLLNTAATVIAGAAPSVAPYLQFRSQGRNNARKVVGETVYQTDLYDMDSWYGSLDLVLEYDRSFRPQNITDALFGADAVQLSTVTTTNNNGSSASGAKHSRSIVVSGSNNTNRAATDWMAENFLLPRNFKSIMSFSPLVQNVLVNFDWFMGLDHWAKGLYFRLYGPVVNNRTSLQFSEAPVSAGSNDGGEYEAGFFSVNDVEISEMFKSAGQFFSGQPLEIAGITFDPLKYAKFQTTGHKSKTGFAELRGEFGWNYLQENYRVGLNLQAAAPTGTRPKAEFMLEPEIGNGKHWELGVGLKGLWTMWRSEDEEKHFDFVVEADITHLFKAKQTRTFDLVGKPNSRYMLAEKLVSNVGSNPILAGASNAGFEFDGDYSPVANFSTRKVTSSFSVQGDVVAMFTYAMRGFTWDIGYNFWGLATEKLSLSSSSSVSSSASDNTLPFPENTWALKGDASVVGQLRSNTDEFVGLAATESTATIHAGTGANGQNAVPGVTPLASAINNGVLATATLDGGTATQVDEINNADNQMFTSNPPVFIKATDLDINGARMRGYSNKVFTHFGYTWTDREKWAPFVGLGASGEFGSHSSRSNNSVSSSIKNNNNSSNGSSSTSFGLSQWAIWLKGGVSFH